MYRTWKNIKKSNKNIKFKISSPTWNGEFEVPDGSYSISDIHKKKKNMEKRLLIFQ